MMKEGMKERRLGRDTGGSYAPAPLSGRVTARLAAYSGNVEAKRFIQTQSYTPTPQLPLKHLLPSAPVLKVGLGFRV